MNWFTSDTHFGHKAVIGFCNRPFTSTEEMDRELIARWNSVVRPSDTVFHMGDVSFRGMVATNEIIQQLNGYKILIKGNHDPKFKPTNPRGFNQVFQNWTVNIGGEEVNLSHYPYIGQEIDERDFSDRALPDDGKWLLHGHVHCGWAERNKMINVGVDVRSYLPVSETEIRNIIQFRAAKEKLKETA